MRHSLKTGFTFGLTSGIITTLGLITGLYASTNSQLVVIGGIFTIAIADALSDAIGIHMCEESEDHHTIKEVWESTISTFCSKFFFSMTFLVPIVVLPLMTAIITSLIWGLSLLSVFSFFTAKLRQSNPWKAIFEHLSIAGIVIVVTHVVGGWVSRTFM